MGNPAYALKKFNVSPISNGFVVEVEVGTLKGGSYHNPLIYAKEYYPTLAAVAARFHVLFISGG